MITVLFVIHGSFFVLFPFVYFGLIPKKSLIERERHYAFTNGYGTWATVAFIHDNLPQDKYVYIAVEDRPGNPSDYLLAYFYYSPTVRVFFLSAEKELRDIKKVFGTRSFYYVARGSAVPSDLKLYLKSLRTYAEPDNGDYVGLYEVVTRELE